MAKKKIVIETKYQVKGAENVKSAYDGIGEGAQEAASKTDEANEAIKGTGEAAAGSKSGLAGMLDGFKAIVMNPIGLVLVALVGAVKFVTEALSGSEQASNKLSQGFAYLGGFIQPLKDAVIFAFGKISEAIASPGETFDKMIDGIETAVDYWKDNILAPYLSAWKLLGLAIFKQITKIRLAWNNLTGDVEESDELQKKLKEIEEDITANQKVITDAAETLKNDVVDAVESVVEGVKTYIEEADKLGDKLSALVKEEQRLLAVRRTQEVQNAKSLADIEKLKVIRDDEAQSLQDRIKANEEIGAIEKQRVESAISLAEAELNATRRNMQLKGRSTELLDLEKEKLIEIQELRSENAGIENEQIVNNTALRKEQFDKEVQLIDAKRDLDAILEEDAVKLAEAVVKAEEDKILKLKELGLEENQVYRDTQGALALAQQEAIKAKLDAQKEADEKLKEKKIKDAADSVKLAKETADRELKIKEAFNSGMIGFSDALTGALGENSKLAANIQKAIALRAIAIDTAQAISALVKNSQANPANAISFGGAGALQFATGLLSIGTNMAKAYSLLKAPTPQLGGGSSSGSAPTTEQTAPSLGFEGKSAGSESFGANVAIKAYVTESDITTSQETSNNIQQLSQIG